MSRIARAAAAAVMVVVSTGGIVHAADQPTPDIVYPDDRAQQQAYEDGFTTGYFDGTDEGYDDGRDDGYRSGYSEGLDTGRERGLAEGEQLAEAQSDLRDEVSDTAEDEPVVEGGRDLGDQITPSPSATPTDDVASSAAFEDEPDEGGFPWWPLSFAVAATAWFVTRRRRLDALHDQGQADA